MSPPALTHSQPAENAPELSVMPLLLVLARRLPLLAGLPLAAAIVAVIYCKLVDPVYTATARILPPQYNENTVSGMQNQLGGESQLGNSALTLKNPTDLFVGVLKSRTIMDAVIDNQSLAEHYGMAKSHDLRQKLGGSTTIRAGKDGIVSISVEDLDPERAAEIANAYVRQFYAFSAELAQQQAQRRSDFYDNALTRARARLDQADMALSSVEKQTGFTRLNGQDQAIVQAAAEIQAQIAAREIQLRTMASYTTEANPDVQLYKRELSHLREELESMKGGLGSTEGRALIELGGAPDALQLHGQRQREVEYWESIVLVVGRFGELGKIDVTRDMSLFQVLDWAIAPEDKSKPRTSVAAILTLLGTGSGCLFWVLASAYVMERRRQSERFEDQWQELLATLLFFNNRRQVSS
ncbi:MAG: Wzz/FepE/Etk N-terminal domain-containing protein [Pseudomonadota bacterium]